MSLRILKTKVIGVASGFITKPMVLNLDDVTLRRPSEDCWGLVICDFALFLGLCIIMYIQYLCLIQSLLDIVVYYPRLFLSNNIYVLLNTFAK